MQVDLAIAAFVARALDVQRVLGGEPSTLGNAHAPDEAIFEMGRSVADRLLVPDSPFLATLRMQLHMEETFQQQKKAVEEELEQKEALLDRLLKELYDPSVTQDSSLREFSTIYDKIFTYVCHRCAPGFRACHRPLSLPFIWVPASSFLRCGLPSALSNDEMRTEVMAAFESVFPQYLMPRFVGFAEEERLNQLEEVSSIVLGVCAYNAHLGQAGEAHEMQRSRCRVPRRRADGVPAPPAGISLSREFSIVGYAQQGAMLRKEIRDRVVLLEEFIEDYVRVLNHQASGASGRLPRGGREDIGLWGASSQKKGGSKPWE